MDVQAALIMKLETTFLRHHGYIDKLSLTHHGDGTKYWCLVFLVLQVLEMARTPCMWEMHVGGHGVTQAMV